MTWIYSSRQCLDVLYVLEWDKLKVTLFRHFWNLVSLHTRSVWESICDTLPHSSYQNLARLSEFLVRNSLSAPTQVFQKCWSGVPPLPLPPSKWKFGQILALGTWAGLDYHPFPTYVRAGVGRRIAVSPKDTVSLSIVVILISGIHCFRNTLY